MFNGIAIKHYNAYWVRKNGGPLNMVLMIHQRFIWFPFGPCIVQMLCVYYSVTFFIDFPWLNFRFSNSVSNWTEYRQNCVDRFYSMVSACMMLYVVFDLTKWTCPYSNRFYFENEWTNIVFSIWEIVYFFFLLSSLFFIQWSMAVISAVADNRSQIFMHVSKIWSNFYPNHSISFALRTLFGKYRWKTQLNVNSDRDVCVQSADCVHMLTIDIHYNLNW